MRQFVTIASNAFMELVRQPVFLLLMTCSSGFSVFLAAVPYFGFGEDPKLVKDSALAATLLAGLFGAVTAASSSLAREIRSGTALAVLAKPIGRAQFLLAKYVGLAGVLGLLIYANLISILLASRMAFDAYGDPDKVSLAIFFGALVLGYALGGFTNFFLRRGFVADAVFFVLLTMTLAFLVIVNFVERDKPFGGAAHVDWRLVPAVILAFFALLVLAAIALACSTRFDIVPTLAICSAVFLLGLISDYLFNRQGAEAPPGWLQPIYSTLYTLVPNWKLFWMQEVLVGTEESANLIPWSYVGKALSYTVCYLGACLALALWMFEDRELS